MQKNKKRQSKMKMEQKAFKVDGLITSIITAK